MSKYKITVIIYIQTDRQTDRGVGYTFPSPAEEEEETGTDNVLTLHKCPVGRETGHHVTRCCCQGDQCHVTVACR